MHTSLRPLLLVLTALVVPAVAEGQARIERLHRDDPLYRQHQQMVAEYHEAKQRGWSAPPLHILSYVPREGDTFFSIAARLMIPHGTIATLNRLDRPALPGSGGGQDNGGARGSAILIPSQPGLFIYTAPRTELERTLAQRLHGKTTGQEIRLPGGEATSTVHFYPGEDFSASERALFLTIHFMDPLPKGVISSRYGFRVHPLTGTRMFHRGLDLAAPFGTPVVSAAPGVVTEIKRDPLLGLSVHVDHGNGYSTVYAHLQESFVREGDPVEQGQVVGAVGSTGFSTGPHLHFEIMLDGVNRDPERYIR